MRVPEWLREWLHVRVPEWLREWLPPPPPLLPLLPSASPPPLCLPLLPSSPLCLPLLPSSPSSSPSSPLPPPPNPPPPPFSADGVSFHRQWIWQLREGEDSGSPQSCSTQCVATPTEPQVHVHNIIASVPARPSHTFQGSYCMQHRLTKYAE